MIYATGDTHRDFTRLEPEQFPEGAALTKEDYVIICGDFGGLWDGHNQDRKRLDRLEALPFTVLFISGNHENFDLLARCPVEQWQGGKVQRIRPHVLHLMRGQVFTLEGQRFFTMGGASSHDMPGGVLEPHSPDFQELSSALRQAGIRYRVNHRSWWRQELPSPEEYQEALCSLEAAGWQVDYILTHCAPSPLADRLTHGRHPHDALTDFLEDLRGKVRYRRWLFGHYHADLELGDGFTLVYEKVLRLL